MSKFTQQALRKAFGTFMTGVTVVTTRTPNGENVGFTANSFTSVSLEPPLVLVCLAKSLASLPVFEQCSFFTVNVLAEAQEDVSNLFASYTGDRFAKVNWQPDANGCAVIEGVTTHFSCRNYQQIDAGDHVILLGEITDFETTGDEGLGYSNQGYYSLGLERAAVEAPKSASSFKVGVIIEAEGGVFLQKTESGLQLPTVEVADRSGALSAIRAYLETNHLDIEFGHVYSIVNQPNTGEYSVYLLANSEEQQHTEMGEYYAVESFTDLTFASQSLSEMVARYALEAQTGVFGLHFGDESEHDR